MNKLPELRWICADFRRHWDRVCDRALPGGWQRARRRAGPGHTRAWHRKWPADRSRLPGS